MAVETSGGFDPPKTTQSARCDEKGRLKLPASFLRYLEGLGEKKVFITTTNRRDARVYPNSLWSKNEAFFQQYKNDPAKLKQMTFVVRHYGDESEIDGQGRILLPSNLRRELGMENGTVWLLFREGRFDLYSDAWYQEELKRNLEGLEQAEEALEKEGMV